MEEELSGPGVEHQSEAELGAEALGIGGKGVEGFGNRREQQVEQNLAVREHHGSKYRGEGEDDVEVSGVEQPALALCNPAVLCRALTGRTVAVQAGIIERHLAATVLAAVEVVSKGRGAAVFQIAQ